MEELPYRKKKENKLVCTRRSAYIETKTQDFPHQGSQIYSLFVRLQPALASGPVQSFSEVHPSIN